MLVLWSGLSRNRQDAVIAIVLALTALVAVLATLPEVGVTWDEPLYIRASRGYMSWLGLLKRGILRADPREALSDAAIVAGWMPHPTLELHPPLGKVLSGLSFATLRNAVGEIAAHRVSTAVLFSLLVAMVFWLVATAYGTASGVFAGLSLLLMPRMFFHAHLANIDIAMAATWFVAMLVFWKMEPRQGLLPILAAGLAFGLALATKMNAIVMPLVWGVWVLMFRRNWRSFTRLAAIAAIGAAVFVALWPWLYHDTANRLAYYFQMASRFKDRPQFYLGQTLPHVPWHYPFVVTLAVVPMAITVMSLLGVFRVIRRRSDDSTGWLVILNTATPLLVAATGLQAAYSGERHFIPAYPYLACLAGIGFGSTLELLRAKLEELYGRRDSRRIRIGLGLVLALLLVPAAVATAQMHPYQLSYYSELVGGLPGATRMGLETTFWCETYRDALPYLNEHAEQGASVWAENPFVLRFYQSNGLLRLDLYVVGGDTVDPSEAGYALVQMRQTGFHYYTPDVEPVMSHHEPVYSVTRQGVPLVHLYRVKRAGLP